MLVRKGKSLLIYCILPEWEMLSSGMFLIQNSLHLPSDAGASAPAPPRTVARSNSSGPHLPRGEALGFLPTHSAEPRPPASKPLQSTQPALQKICIKEAPKSPLSSSRELSGMMETVTSVSRTVSPHPLQPRQKRG